MADKPVSSQEGTCPEGQEEETNSHSFNSDPEKSEGKEHNITTLEQELDSLKHVVAQQNQVLQQFGAHLLTPPRQVTTSKPRDIPVLELHQLQGLNATTQLQIFFELVEQCSVVDTTRVQIAKGRVSPEIAAIIHNHQTLHNCNSWDSLKELLNSHFNKEVNFARAWQNINCERYNWSESPQAFVNNFICRYAILETRFAKENSLTVTKLSKGNYGRAYFKNLKLD